MKINISKDYQKYALEIDIKRHEAKALSFRNKSLFNNVSIPNESTGIPNEYMPHYIGVLGEIAWSIATGENIDTNIYPVRDNGEDFNGVEIKTITYKGLGEPELKITKKEFFERKSPRIYVLTRIDITSNNAEVEILGKIEKREFDRLKVEKQYGKNKPINYIVPLSLMTKI